MADRKSKKVRMMVSRGNPTGGGAIIRAGAIVELPAFLAEQYVADGTAEFCEEAEPKAETKVKGKNGKSKS